MKNKKDYKCVVILMFFVVLLCLIIALISVYKNYNKFAKVISLVALGIVVCFALSDIFPTVMVLSSGFGGIGILLWDLVNIALLSLSAVLIWCGKTKAAKVVLWIIVVILFVQYWNEWLGLYFALRRLITE